MPNFKCKKLKNLKLPFKYEEVEFLWKVHDEDRVLVYTSINEQNFFIQIHSLKDFILVKLDKHSRITQTAYAQKALIAFKECFCEEIINQAIALKSPCLLEKNIHIENDLHHLFSKIQAYKKIYLEIGFGSGRHLLYQARNHKDILMLGIEIYTPALEQVAKTALREKLDNIILTRNDARILLKVLKENTVAKIFLHFPVPWLKQAQRRVLSALFIQECQRVLEENGSFELRTDSKEYLDYALELILNLEKIRITVSKNCDLNIISKYEARWKRANKDIYDLILYNLENKNPTENTQTQDFSLQDLNLCTQKLKNIQNNFKKQKIKGEDFFLSLEKLYKKDEQFLLLKIAFGAFAMPQHSYIILSKSCAFCFKEPLKTKANLKALKELKGLILKLAMLDF